MGELIGKCIGCIRFHLKCIWKKRSVRYVGLKQYLGRGAVIATKNEGKIEIGKAIYLSAGSQIWASQTGILKIGNNNFFNSNVNVGCLRKIEIGDNNLFAPNIVIVDHNHKYDRLDMLICRQGYDYKEVKIGSDCWICANVVICAGAEISDHIIVSANSVVSGKLTEPGIYAGNPAKLIKRMEK